MAALREDDQKEAGFVRVSQMEVVN
ncbi:hypothetical protein METHB2_140002 [Candidatus Methylobacter favarea]|uniref:Uncharacterized protein n=1 Tax=Candidatus Methylobacter favarea TaxID=2707345 RepID=A0A8S0X767_9GAMM|nr:hypothetical protein METHB2_140002 [Candidatus Methylobacter favarea]